MFIIPDAPIRPIEAWNKRCTERPLAIWSATGEGLRRG